MANSSTKTQIKTSQSAFSDFSAPQTPALVAGRRYHFIGAGGIGMSGLAKILLKNRAIVSGSDMEGTTVTKSLQQMGAAINIGHDSGNVPQELDAVVISAAVKQDNPELIAAHAQGCAVYKYAEMLGELMDGYSGIAVCGTHGKSTTSGWLSHLLTEAGFAPNYIVGADIPQLGCSCGVGDSNYFVAEACEYDRSFLNLHPHIAVILNIEQDHLDYYRDEADIVDAFTDFAKGITDGGVIIANGQDQNVATVLERAEYSGKNIQTFGSDSSCDFYADNIVFENGLPRFDIYHGNIRLGRAEISLPGQHNITNALAVTAACICAGISAEDVLKHIGKFTGVDRRLMLKADIDNIRVMDDYAHHPTEIQASLSAVRSQYSPKRLWCIFQPHQYSRTRFLLDDFAQSFKLADVTIVPEIYFVRDTQENKKLVNAEVLVEKICDSSSKAIFINDFTGIVEYLKENVTEGDLVITMGAGDIWKVADEYIQWLGRNS